MSFSGFTISEIVEWSGGRLVNAGVLSSQCLGTPILRIAPLDESKVGDLAFFFSKKYQAELLRAEPSVLITAEPFLLPLEKSGLPLWKTAAVISCADPYFALALLSERFAPHVSTVSHLPGSGLGSVHSSAVVAPSAKLGEGVQIGAHCVVESGATLGRGTILYPGCFVGPEVEIGNDCVLFPRVTLYERVKLGDRVRIHAGTVVGADGFGYVPVMKDGKIVSQQKIYHLGRVVIGSDVEIGANTCIDRGTLKDTVIGDGSKLDDHVMIGHNCQLGKGVIVCGSAGMAGSVEVGDFVYVGGLSGIANGVKIGDRAKLAGGTFVSGNIDADDKIGGHPHRKFRDFLKLQIILDRLLVERSIKTEKASTTREEAKNHE